MRIPLALPQNASFQTSPPTGCRDQVGILQPIPSTMDAISSVVHTPLYHAIQSPENIYIDQTVGTGPG